MKKLPDLLLWLAVGGCLTLTSCKKRMPSDVIPPDRMEDILYDYHLAQAVGTEFNGEERYKRELLTDYVFEKHHITEAQFDSSMVWYTRNMEKLDDIYQNLSKRYEDANKNLATLYQERKQQTTVSGDTVSLWQGKKMYVLTPAALTNRLTFNLTADTTYHQLDRFTWEMDVLRPDSLPINLYAGLTLSYRNDSTQAVMRTVTRNGRLVLNIKADTLQLRSIQGFIYLSDSVKSALRPVVLGNVSLTRIHPTSVELKRLEAMRRKAAEKADSIAQSTTDTLNSKKEKQPETPDTTSVTKTPQRLSPAELRRQQQRQR